MCGIVGLISHQPVANRLIDGLKRLEYRGYDSAGIATLVEGKIVRRRSEGKLANLEKVVQSDPIDGYIGIGHTRWATHGAPVKENAHPHASELVAVVHNGIIENYAELKSMLEKEGHVFSSQTDTEVVVHLLTHYVQQGLTPLQSVQKALKEFKGAFALVITFKGFHDFLIVARRGSPLVIGHGDQEMMIGSDALALAPWTQKLTYLEEGDYGVIHQDRICLYDQEDRPVQRKQRLTNLTGESVSKGVYRHYMLKEMFEQPTAIGNTLSSLVDADHQKIVLPEMDIKWADISRLTMIACGTAYYAGALAKYWIEKYAKLPVEIDIASEFRYREPPLPSNGLAVVISQSGETIDTLCGLQLAKERGLKTLAVVNVPESSIDRQADYTIYTQAGPEIGVASTKAFTCQLTVLACLTIHIARERGFLSVSEEKNMVRKLSEVPTLVLQQLQNDHKFQELAAKIHQARDILYLGRGTSYPIALEGALKMKELSYIHAEGYPAGELKHGPIALIDSQVPVVVIAPGDQWLEKTMSNMQEVLARGAQVICITDKKGLEEMHGARQSITTLCLPVMDSFIAPIVYSIPVQFLAYYTAVLRGTDVDQPRNLAKSVTVE
jgi:glucosamine--fructose-6-phosphate aminotransferase (isomerizing)